MATTIPSPTPQAQVPQVPGLRVRRHAPYRPDCTEHGIVLAYQPWTESGPAGVLVMREDDGRLDVWALGSGRDESMPAVYGRKRGS